MKRIVILLMGWTAVLSLAGCGGSGGGAATSPVSTTYSTTSDKGDYAEWTLTGKALTATWHVINTTGGIDYIYNIVASCTAEAANGTRTCTVDAAASSCADGMSTCSSLPGSFDLMEAPDVALFVHTVNASGSDELHVGFVKNGNACTDDVSGDYTFIRTGLGLDEAFGMYRSDTNFLHVRHSDFGFDTSAQNVTPTVRYRTGSASESFSDGSCVGGVRTRTSGADTFRSMMTKSGLFILDMPAGQGGLLSFKTSKAASLANFVSKRFKGIVFPDDGPPQLITATSGAMMAGPEVPLTAIIPLTPGPAQTMNLKVQALGTQSTINSPGYPDFTVAPAGYSASTLAASYAAPSDIPGLFKLDGELLDRNGSPDAGRIILAAMNFNSKLIIIGMNYNYRTTKDKNPATGANFNAANLYNTGNFVLFEK